MIIEQPFIDAINAEQGEGDRLAEYVYADWLEGQGDPRAEAWRVLIGWEKFPYPKPPRLVRQQKTYRWYRNVGSSPWWSSHIGENFWYLPHSGMSRSGLVWIGETYFAAMNAACISWVRCHRNPDYQTEIERV